MAPRERFVLLVVSISLVSLFCNRSIARTIVVHPGDSIRSALASAVAGVVRHRVVVTVKDRNGHQSVDEHVGSPRKRIKFMDRLGRIRTWCRK